MTKFFVTKNHFMTKNFLWENFFMKKIFHWQNFFLTKFFMKKNFWQTKFSWQKYFCDENCWQIDFLMTKIFFYDKNFFLTKSFFMTKQSVRVHSRDVSRPKNDLRVFDKLRMKDSLTGISVRSLVFEPTKLGNPVENKYDQNHEPRRKKDGYKNINNKNLHLTCFSPSWLLTQTQLVNLFLLYIFS